MTEYIDMITMPEIASRIAFRCVMRKEDGIDHMVTVLNSSRDDGCTRLIEIDNGGKNLVTVFADGTIEYGVGYYPEKAARLFWEGLCMIGSVRDGLAAAEKARLATSLSR